MREPDENSGQYYKAFYNIYSFMQLSNLAFHSLLESASNNDIKEFIDEHNGRITNNDDRICVHLLGMGIDARGLYDKGDKSNVFTNVFDTLSKKGLSFKYTLEFFLNLQEFILIYALFEDNIKAIIGNPKATQSGLMRELEQFIVKKNKLTIFTDKISEMTGSTIEAYNEIKSLWTYFTIIRNLYAHSAGIVTDRVLGDLEKIKNEIGDFCNKKNFLLLNIMADNDEDVLNFLLEKEQLYVITDCQLNFFRSFIVYILEALDITI
ncbi:hypothetical protein [Clostridium formicaceticum]|nr:hypothetical protein [Clostridium formicaceticum]